jgi:hypothetical protein
MKECIPAPADRIHRGRLGQKLLGVRRQLQPKGRALFIEQKELVWPTESLLFE